MKKVITYGSFDLFHEGHYNLLKRAKALGDYLIVGVTTEQYDESRGKLNIVDSLDKRIENVRQTGFADEIIVEDHPGQKVEDVQKYGIDIFTVGSDWTGAFDHMKLRGGLSGAYEEYFVHPGAQCKPSNYPDRCSGNRTYRSALCAGSKVCQWRNGEQCL